MIKVEKFIYSLVVVFTVLSSCEQKHDKSSVIPVTVVDTTITEKNAFTLLTLDSQAVRVYLDSAALSDTGKLLFKNFYNSRNYQYAWFDEKGLSEHAGMIWNLYQEYAGYAHNVPYPDTLLEQQIELWLADSATAIQPSTARKIELQLSRLFFDYAFAKYIGNLDPLNMQWYIPRRKINVSDILDSLISGNRNPLKDWEPLHPQYKLLKIKLLAYSLIDEKGGWPLIADIKNNKFKEGDKDSTIFIIKRRLMISGNFPTGDSSLIYTRQLKDSIMVIQEQFGLPADGVIGQATIEELNVPVKKRIQQLLINMERLRWLPRQPTGDWVMVNIPSFRLQAFKDDSLALQMKIVVGKAATKTVIFSDEIKNIVFSPYWNVPNSIVRNEILPSMRRSKNYLRRMNMEQIGTSNGLPMIRQKPGPTNALGLVKFLFPNNYNIYLHDTPAKSYFNEPSRAFSHGCIRVSQPFELAEYLLRNDSSWNHEAINKAMHAGKEKWVSLKEHVPVFITYFTSWVDKYGRLQFRRDIYGHDQRMAEQLFASGEM